METITTILIGVLATVGSWFTTPETPQQNLGAFDDPFISIQLATDPDNGECLTTDGTDNVWSSCSAGSGDITGGASRGTGVNIYDSESAGILRFNSISAGTNVSFSTSSDNNTIVISSTGGSSFAWPFDVSTNYVSTSSKPVGFLNGIFSTASSTFSGNTFFPALSQGFAYLGTSGKLNTIASSSIALSWFNNDAGFLTTVDISANTNLTAGDALTLTDDDIDFDGGASPAGDLGGTWANPSVDDDSHAHTGTTLSGIDISDDTNLTAGDHITLTGDDLDIDDDFILNTGDTYTGLLSGPYSSSTIYSSFITASTTNLNIGGQSFIGLLGNGLDNTNGILTANCIEITGSADLCDGSDASGVGGSSAYEIATTSNIAVSQLAYIAQTGGRTTLASVATGTITGGDSLTVDATRYVIGGNLDIDCDVASGSQSGCLSTTDWTTFNNSLDVLGSGYASTTQAHGVTFSTTTQSFNGLTIAQRIIPTTGALTFTPNISGTLDNTGLTNSTISGVSLGSNLANLTATDATLTFSGTYNGSAARTIGLNLANPNTWSVLQTFNYSSSTIYSSFITASTTNLNIGGQSFVSLLGNGLDNTAGVLTANCIEITGSADLCDGGDASASFSGAANSIIVSNSAGNAVVATSSHPLYVGAILATSTTDFNRFAATTTVPSLQVGPTAIGNSGLKLSIPTGLTISGSESVGGVFNMNLGTTDSLGMALYNNHTGTSRLLSLVCDAATYGGNCFHVRSDGTESAFNIIGATLGKGVGKFTHQTAGDSDASILSLDASSAGYLGQGIFVDCTGGSCTGTNSAFQISDEAGNNGNFKILWNGKTGIASTTPTGARLSVNSVAGDNFSLWVGSTTAPWLRVSNSGFGTTTLSGLDIIGSATSTSNVGYNITTGCYAIAGVCIGGGSSGAPTDADYLVGTANGSLSNEIVVGTSPGGELGGTWGSPTIDDSLAVTSWNLTTPTFTTNFVFDAETFDSLTDDATLANNSGDLQVVDVTCTDCLNETEIEDLFLLNTSDSFSGLLSGPYSSSTIYSSFITASSTFARIGTLTLDADLTVANGGTGASTLTGLLQGNGTSAFTAITDSSTVGQILRVTGASTYAWGALNLDDTDAFTGTLPASAIEDSYLLNNGDIGTGNFDFGGATFFEIPNGTGNTADDPGEIAHDTTDNQLVVDDFVMARGVQHIWSRTIASTSDAFIGGSLMPLRIDLDGYTMTAIRCKVDGGTSKVIAIEDASANSTEDITCATTVTSDDGSITNASATAAEEMYIDFGATSGAVDYVTISVFGTYTRE